MSFYLKLLFGCPKACYGTKNLECVVEKLFTVTYWTFFSEETMTQSVQRALKKMIISVPSHPAVPIRPVGDTSARRNESRNKK